MKVWILTKEYNDYNQHGEYFVAAFKGKPSREQVAKIVNHYSDSRLVDKILEGGGRVDYDHLWYWLREEECQ